MNKLIYGINDSPKTIKEWFLYALQQLLAVFCATVLIAQICNTPISACFMGACVGTLVYQLITRFKSPMFISSCGATVSAVLGALSLNAAGNNYLMVFIGGLTILFIYAIFACIIKFTGIKTINKIFPPVIVGSVTMVIGLNLATFIFGYVGGTTINGIDSVPWLQVLVAIFTMICTAITAHYGKGFIKQIPFLVGIACGYVASLFITYICKVPLLSFESFKTMQWYPDLAFLKWSTKDWSWINCGKTVLYFLPVGICALLEHYSDHKTLSNIIGTDLTETPGLDKTLLGDGLASAIGTAICGLPNTSYGESIATTGFSKVASTKIISLAAILLGGLSFIAPITSFIETIPSCLFGGVCFILYGYIILSGLQTLMNNKIELSSAKNTIIISVILTAGVSGIYLFDAAFSGVALAMVLGVILNLILIDKKTA